jgi:hypothetical protein
LLICIFVTFYEPDINFRWGVQAPPPKQWYVKLCVSYIHDYTVHQQYSQNNNMRQSNCCSFSRFVPCFKWFHLAVYDNYTSKYFFRKHSDDCYEITENFKCYYFPSLIEKMKRHWLCNFIPVLFFFLYQHFYGVILPVWKFQMILLFFIFQANILASFESRRLIKIFTSM